MLEGLVEEILITEQELTERIKSLGAEITDYYRDKTEEVIMVCILRGGFIFMADLAREVEIPVTLDFMDVTSYQGRTTTGNVRIIKDLEENIEGKNLLLIEDIIDTGTTLKHVIEMLETRNPKSIQICTLLDKPERRLKKEVAVDWNGFEIPNKFVLGYGLDYQEKYRNLPYIFIPKPEVYEED